MNTCGRCKHAKHSGVENCVLCGETGGVVKRNNRACSLYAISAYAFLQSVSDLEKRIESTKERMRHYREMAEKSTSSMEATRVSGSGSHSKLADSIDRVIDGEREIAREIEQMMHRYATATRLIGNVSTPEGRKIIQLRFFERKRWDRIAIDMVYDESHVRRLGNRALREIQTAMDEEGISE